jgi:hypothetical protein
MSPVDAMDAETIKRFAELLDMFDEQHDEHSIAVEAATVTLSGVCRGVVRRR